MLVNPILAPAPVEYIRAQFVVELVEEIISTCRAAKNPDMEALVRSLFAGLV